MSVVLIVLLVVPLVPAVLAVFAPPVVAKAATVAIGLVCFGLTVVLVPAAAHGGVQVGFLRVDALSAVFLLAIGFPYAATAGYAIGYLQGEESTVYMRRFYLGLNVFAWSMLCAPTVNGLALLWIAIEITTVVSALLVAIEDTDGAVEVSWKYVLLASAGLGIALLGTIFLYSHPRRDGGAALDRAAVPVRRARLVGYAAVRDLPQRVHDRRRRAASRPQHRHRRPGRFGDRRVPRPVRGPPPAPSTPRTRNIRPETATARP
jgi:hydrogenase-4 component F